MTDLQLASVMIAAQVAIADMNTKRELGIGYGYSIESYSVRLAKFVLAEADVIDRKSKAVEMS